VLLGQWSAGLVSVSEHGKAMRSHINAHVLPSCSQRQVWQERVRG
jgi:hypothetical protein